MVDIDNNICKKKIALHLFKFDLITKIHKLRLKQKKSLKNYLELQNQRCERNSRVVELLSLQRWIFDSSSLYNAFARILKVLDTGRLTKAAR